MRDCNNCKHKDCREYAEPCNSCTDMTGEPTNWEPQTNADRIRAMTDEELANFLFPLGSCPVVADGLPFNESAPTVRMIVKSVGSTG